MVCNQQTQFFFSLLLPIASILLDSTTDIANSFHYFSGRITSTVVPFGILNPPLNIPFPLPTTTPPPDFNSGNPSLWFFVNGAVFEDLNSFITISFVFLSIPIASTRTLVPSAVLIVTCSTASSYCLANLANSFFSYSPF